MARRRLGGDVRSACGAEAARDVGLGWGWRAIWGDYRWSESLLPRNGGWVAASAGRGAERRGWLAWAE